ncbi:GNAT family N-acetyltransferase [Kitasatospora sp. NPDC059088]|uniref:GNAT family N-acetyltransferase n=1 Tax=Kitasatospora sp. NPDC059088 TaxID=3346722 RepID=UPI00367BF18A
MTPKQGRRSSAPGVRGISAVRLPPGIGNGPAGQLRPATEQVRLSYVAALREYQAEGLYPDLNPVALSDPAAFRAYVHRIRQAADSSVQLPPGWVPESTFWWIAQDRYLGRLAIRHRLTPALQRRGGHIGFDVRPSARNQGCAKRMLMAALPHAARLGLEHALLTCDVDNLASQRVIFACGGELIDRTDGILRFTLRTSVDPATTGEHLGETHP